MGASLLALAKSIYYSTSFKGKQIDRISLNGLDKVYCRAYVNCQFLSIQLFMFVL